MPDTYKRLGAEEIDGAGNAVDTDIQLYVVPGDTQTIVSTILAHNKSANLATIRIAHPNGAIGTVAEEDYLQKDVKIPSLGVTTIQLGITMVAADTLLVRSDIVDVNFIAWGVEKS